MTFLPIVERELRVGARRTFTYWSRVWAALFCLLVFCGVYGISLASKGAVFNDGQASFAVLKWLSFVFAGMAGVFLTSDSLSEEKRDGTLGLLFLTDLRGHDVVLGKLASSSVQALYGFLAAFPILALPLLAGGITGAQFWSTLLVISNTLFLSISIGLAVSSISRESTHAMNAALAVSVFFLGGLQLVDLAMAGFDPVGFVAQFSLASPGYLLFESGPFQPRYYWLCLGIQHGMGWGFLALASICTPRAWQEKTTSKDATKVTLGQRWRFGGWKARRALRRRLLQDDPILWLAARDRLLPRFVWSMVLICLILFGCASVGAWKSMSRPPIVTTTASSSTVTKGNSTATRVSVNVMTLSRAATQIVYAAIMLGVELWLAAQACRFFVDAVRTGALELILVTPVTSWQIVQGQRRALWRTYLIPAVGVILIMLISGYLSIVEMRRNFPASSPGAASGYSTFITYQIWSVVAGLVNFVTSLLALAWFGMWMGLTTRKTSIAVLKTFGCVIVLPWVGLTFASIIIMMAVVGFRGGPMWISAVVMMLLHLGKDLFFILWSRHHLFANFRETITQDGRAPRHQLPPVLAVPALPAAVAASSSPPVSAKPET